MRDPMVENFPNLNPNSNAVVRVSVSSPTAPDHRDNGYVELRIEDHASGVPLVVVQMDPARVWRLLQGGVQTWEGFISPHLDRVGKQMQNMTVVLPAPIDGDEPRDLDRDVHKAVVAQLPADWHYAFDSYDKPRRTNRNTLETVVRRWVPVTTTEDA